MSSRLFESLRHLRDLSTQHEAVIVSYSGGKDSEALLTMATRTFKRVIGLFMYFVPGLDYNAEVRARAGARVHGWIEFPHWVYVNALRNNIYCNYAGADKLPELTLNDIYRLAMKDTGVNLVLTGARKSDSLWRRRWFSNIESQNKWVGVQFPMKDWNKEDVLSYLKANGIPIPKLSMTKSSANGIDLYGPTILWLYDNLRADYERIRETFPFIEAAVYRREWHGVT